MLRAHELLDTKQLRSRIQNKDPKAVCPVCVPGGWCTFAAAKAAAIPKSLPSQKRPSHAPRLRPNTPMIQRSTLAPARRGSNATKRHIWAALRATSAARPRPWLLHCGMRSRGLLIVHPMRERRRVDCWMAHGTKLHSLLGLGGRFTGQEQWVDGVTCSTVGMTLRQYLLHASP